MIIAEIGINHNGEMQIAKNLIDMAFLAGCDIVKFQKRNPDICVPESYKNRIKNTPWGDMTYLEYKHRIEFGKEEYDEIDKFFHVYYPFIIRLIPVIQSKHRNIIYIRTKCFIVF